MTPHDRAALVLTEAWRLLPPIKHEAPLVDIVLEDMGATHGTYTPSTGVLRLSRQLFTADPLGTRRLFDLHGDDPARTTPYCERDLHTTLHELAHAIGAGTGLDEAPGWQTLSGWVQSWYDLPETGRYHELRPGWDQEISPWRYRLGTWFPRAYASKSPQECFADCVAALCLGWAPVYGPAAQPKFQWLRRHIFGEVKAYALQTASARWRTSLDAHIDAALSPSQRVSRWRTAAERALTDGVTALLDAWVQAWMRQGTDLEAARWSSLARMADDLLQVVRPPLTKLWQQLTGTTTPLPPQAYVIPTVTFAQTTLDKLRSWAAPAMTHGRDALKDALHAVHTDALTKRLPLLVTSATSHLREAAARSAAFLQGATHATWHTTSGNPCAWCADLEGQTFPLTAGPLWDEGATLVNSAGKPMVLDYEAIYHPPIHPWCQCELTYF